MSKLTHDEVKILIKACQLARKKGIKSGISVKEICQKAGISRKTGYQWLKEEQISNQRKQEEYKKLVHMKVDHQKLLNQKAKLQFEIEGMQLAMEIHCMDEVIKKNDTQKKRAKKQ